MMKKIIYVFAGILLLMSSCKTINGPWENLIKSDLNDWVQLNGPATYQLIDGVIVGTTVTSSPSDDSFFCTKADYGDFILEFDNLVDPEVNSGVNIRSESHPNYLDGQVYGYQVEIDPSKRAWTGGIYDESRRGWLYPLDSNPDGQKAFKNGEWNHFRVEAVGNSIRTWVNGVPCADLIDDMTPSGFIGIQVHGIGTDSSKMGKVVKWKNIRIITRDVMKYITPYEPVIIQKSFLTNKLSEREVKDGWKLLWDGKTTNGWRGAKLITFPEGGWEIKDGALTTLESGGGESTAGGDIVTVDKYKNFELIVDFKYSPKANSGIKYLVNTELNKGAGSSIGCEYQILDDKQHPDAQEGIAGNRTLAGLYDLIAPLPKRDNGAGQWNRATIIVNGNHVEHWLNGLKTVEYERGNDAWRALVAKSKFKVWPNFGEASDGHILLQEHGNAVSFKNVKIREL
jgi:Domain of Unknown Function (DUF1080)